MLSFIILLVLMALPWLRVARPGGGPVGQVILRRPLPLLARMRMHAAPSIVLVVAATGMAVFWTLPWWAVLLALVSVVALVACPIEYTLTTLGIRMGWTRFRRWTEFAGVSRAPGGARLQGAAGARDRRIWLSGSRGDDEFLALLRRMIRDAYKGQNVLQEFPPRSSRDTPGSTAAASKVSRTAI